MSGPSAASMSVGWPRWAARQAVLLAATVIALQIAARLLDGVSIDGRGTSWIVSIVIGLLGAVVWPVALRYGVRLVVLTVGLAAFALQVAMVVAAARIVPGFTVESLVDALLVSLVVASVNGVISSLLGFDDPARQRARVVRALGNRSRIAPTSVPGVLFIQIDGLAHDVLIDAIASGHAPMMGELLASGSHRLTEWECDLSSQTGAMQAGIMFGDNSNMPAFRWYDKQRRRVMVSNNAADAAEIEASRRHDSPLLVGGVSRGNVFSGGAADSLYTFATLRSKRSSDTGLVPLFATPGSLLRIAGMAVADMVREVRANRTAQRLGELPLGDRGGIYPVLRSAVNIGLTEITVATLIGDIHCGVPSAYADFVGYDEVAHHSGPHRPDALDALRRIDDRIALLCDGFAKAPRPYELVLLSDHGQSQGSTFLQRYDITLSQLITSLTDRPINEPETVTEGWGNVNGILTGIVDDESFSAQVVKRMLRGRTEAAGVEVGPDKHESRPTSGGDGGEIIVLASGNLGLVSFTDIDGRAGVGEIEERYPGLISGLVDHPGIGFVMVHSDAVESGVVMSADGVRRLGDHPVDHLLDDQVDGVDPLADFGPNAARHLARTDSFDNCPDLIINSFFDPEAGNGAAFEELIGFHGGLGGLQSAPFLLAPAHLPDAKGPLVGAESIHRLFTCWKAEIQGHSN